MAVAALSGFGAVAALMMFVKGETGLFLATVGEDVSCETNVVLRSSLA